MTPHIKLAHEHLPLETLLSTREHRFQRAFAYEALETLGAPPHGVHWEPSHEGLRIYGRDEIILEQAIARIQRQFIGQGVLEWPKVRYRFGRTLEEPVMRLLAEGPETAAESIRAEVSRRAAENIELVVESGCCVVQARATLRRLIGLPAAVRHATSDSVKLCMWLSHYQPVQSAPDPQAA